MKNIEDQISIWACVFCLLGGMYTASILPLVVYLIITGLMWMEARRSNS